MDAIKITQESLDAFKKGLEMAAAPVDGKNVGTDWVEEIFDCQTALRTKNREMGFIGDCPVIATWRGNAIYWKFFEEESISDLPALGVLKSRLEYYDDANSELQTTYEVVGNIYVQKFYWKDYYDGE